MPDPPKPPRPRPEAFPPPLPGSLQGEPFPLAKDLSKLGCCPFVRSGGLHGDDCADLGRGRCTVDIGQVTAAGKAKDPEFRMRSTPPSGSLLLNREVEQLSGEDPRDATLREMRTVNVILREKLAAMAVAPSPVPPGPVSLRTMTKRELAKVTGQWTFLLALLGLLLPIAAKKWPAYADLIEYVRSLLP